MDQISTLKWIAVNGNPIGTGSEAEKAYLQHKSDPTFRKLALDLAANGNPIGRGDVEKEYLQYKDTLGTGSTKAKPKSEYAYPSKDAYNDLRVNVGEVGYSGLDPEQKKLFDEQFSKSKFALAGIDRGEDPAITRQKAIEYVDSQARSNNTPSKQLMDDWNKPSNNPNPIFGKGIGGLEYLGEQAYEHPGTAGAMALSPFVPLSLGGVIIAGGMGTGAHVVDRLQAEQLHPSDRPINYTEETVDALGAGVGSGLTHGILSAGAGAAKSFARPYMKELEEANKANEEILRNKGTQERLNQLRLDREAKLQEELVEKYADDPWMQKKIMEGRITNSEMSKANEELAAARRQYMSDRVRSNPEKYPQYWIHGMGKEGTIGVPSDEFLDKLMSDMLTKELVVPTGYRPLEGFPSFEGGFRRVADKINSWDIPVVRSLARGVSNATTPKVGSMAIPSAVDASAVPVARTLATGLDPVGAMLGVQGGRTLNKLYEDYKLNNLIKDVR